MGMAFFVASGVFNPLDYGLSVGDTINVIAVGGGGSGSLYSGHGVASQGASGGTSSFGAFLTAAGGSGATQTGGTSTPGDGQYQGGMAVSAHAGGGAGGWVPGLPESGGHGGPGLTLPTVSGFVLQLPTPTGTAGMGGLTVSTTGAFSFIQNNKYVMPNYPTYTNSGSMFAQLPSAGFCSGGGAGRGNLASLNNATYTPVHRNGAGGSGFGAGGGGGQQGGGGGAGFVKQASVTLTSVSPIAVTVGGGASPAFARAAVQYNSNPGGAGFGGAQPFPGVGAGGYNGVPGGTSTYSNSTANNLYDVASGGGAGGCVMVLW